MNPLLKRTMTDGMSMLLTLADEDDTPMPASPFYLAFGSDIARFENAVRLCERLKALVATGETLRITDEGRRIAAEFQQRLAEVEGGR